MFLDELELYRECPAKYRFKYIDNETPEFIEAHKWIKIVLDKLFARYIYHQLGGQSSQLATMKRQFYDMWNSSELPIGPEPLAKEMNVIALAGLFNFWKSFSDFFAFREGSEPYILPRLPFNVGRIEWRTPNNNVIHGYIDAVYYNTLGPNIVKWVYYPPHEDDIDTEYEILLFNYAYRKKTGDVPVDLLVYYLYDATSVNFQGGKPHFAIRFYDYLIDAFESDKKRKTFYPRPGIHCRRCPFRTVCMEKHGVDLNGGIKYGRRKRYPSLTSPTTTIQRSDSMSELRRTLDV